MIAYVVLHGGRNKRTGEGEIIETTAQSYAYTHYRTRASECNTTAISKPQKVVKVWTDGSCFQMQY